MFDFFEDLIEKLGIKLISDFGSKLFDWITDIKKETNEEKNNNDGDRARIGSSGYYAQIGSSGGSARIGSSGDNARIGSSGYYAQIGSSGDRAQIGSSGYSARIGSSGDNARIGSSGDRAQIGSSGYYAQIGSSGYYAQIGSSGDRAQIGSSGYSARIGSSGDNARIGSSGDRAQIGSSGDSARIDITGNNSVGFACGWRDIMKAKKGTWIALCEWQKDNENNWIPFFAQTAQIGNKDYKDFKGRSLKETEYYCLHNKKFYPVDLSDGIKILKVLEKKKDNITIIKGFTFDDEWVYLVKENDISAHGESLKEAMDDLLFKKLKNTNTEEIVKKIKETGKVTRAQYRAITGACQFGTEQFCRKHRIEGLEEIELNELRKMLTSDNYGAEKFWSLIDE